jgi:hypothetical protein
MFAGLVGMTHKERGGVDISKEWGGGELSI